MTVKEMIGGIGLMRELLKIQKQYIAALERAVSRPIELLTAAKYAAGNHISECRLEGCTSENRCNFCESWSKVWDDIDKYLEDNKDDDCFVYIGNQSNG